MTCITYIGGTPNTTTCPCGFSILGSGLAANKTLSTSQGTLIITQAGQVVDGIDHDGCIIIRANNVTVQNSRITCNLSAPAVRQEALYSGARILNNTIVGGPAGSGAGISGANLTAVGNEIEGTTDGIQITGDNVKISDNYVHNMRVLTGTHNDTIQIVEGDNIVISGNVLIGGTTNQSNSTIFAQSDFGPITNLSIEENYLAGSGFTVRFNNNVSGIIRNNTFGITPMPLFAPIGITGTAQATVEDNVWTSGVCVSEANNICGPLTAAPIQFGNLTQCRC